MAAGDRADRRDSRGRLGEIMTPHDGYLSTDPARSTSTCSTAGCRPTRTGPWAGPRDVVRVDRGSLVFGCTGPDGRQVGFARAVTDARRTRSCATSTSTGPCAASGWAPGSSAGRDHLRGLGFRRLLLATADAHGVYAKFGFTPLAEPQQWMELDRRR